MKKCNRCDVSIMNDVSVCPLCARDLEKVDDEFTVDYPNVVSFHKSKWVLKMGIFFSVILMGLSLMINMMVQPSFLWSLIVIGSILYIWVSVFLTIHSSKNLGRMILIQIISISGLSVIIDVLSGYNKWSTNYVLPFLIMSGAFVITLIILIKPMLFRDYVLYQFTIALLGLLSILLLILGASTVLWTAISAMTYSALTLVGMFLFADRKTKHELKKRFHF